MKTKFYYINKEQYDQIGTLFALKKPQLKVVLNEFGEWQDVATYSETYGTVVFTTVRKEASLKNSD